MLNAKIQSALNKQINEEYYSSYLYLAMAAYMDDKNLDGCAHWMRMQAQEEHLHGNKIFDYVVERGGRIELFLPDLLGRGIRGRARGKRCLGPSRFGRFECNAEVRKKRISLFIEQNVGWLDVSVDNAASVRGCKSSADLFTEELGRPNRQRAGIESLFEGSAPQPAHDDVGRVGIPPEVDERHDVRVFEPCNQVRLGFEASNEVGLCRELTTNLFDRDLTIDRRLYCSPHHGERASADLFEKPVAT